MKRVTFVGFNVQLEHASWVGVWITNGFFLKGCLISINKIKMWFLHFNLKSAGNFFAFEICIRSSQTHPLLPTEYCLALNNTGRACQFCWEIKRPLTHPDTRSSHFFRVHPLVLYKMPTFINCQHLQELTYSGDWGRKICDPWLWFALSSAFAPWHRRLAGIHGPFWGWCWGLSYGDVLGFLGTSGRLESPRIGVAALTATQTQKGAFRHRSFWIPRLKPVSTERAPGRTPLKL